MRNSKVSIQFSCLTNLWSFRMDIKVNVFEMNLAKMMITCECNEAHIELAIKKYGGKVLNSFTEKA